MYSFEPLDRNVDTIRLLVITGGHDNNIHCELEHRALGSKPVYDALSYTWGEEQELKTIQVNDQPFVVRENLYNALRNFRHLRRCTLWVDAICINQADKQEREYQVSLMPYIYGRAHQVLVWLGDAPEPYTPDELKKEPNSWSIVKQNAISKHPYWLRRWPMQELIIANDVRVYLGQGDFSLSFPWYGYPRMHKDKEHEEFTQWLHLIQEHRGNTHTDARRLECLLETFQETQCTERLDKIFALLGLSSDADAIEADYRAGYFDLYTKLIQFHQTTKPLPPDVNTQLGSVRKWVPRFRDMSARPKLTTEVDRSARLVHYSQLVQNALDGGVDEDVRATTILGAPKTSYLAKGVLAGEILYLGLTYSEMVSSWKDNKSWKRVLEEYCNDEVNLSDFRQNDAAYTRHTLKWSQREIDGIRNVATETSYGYQQNPGGRFFSTDSHGKSREAQVSQPRLPHRIPDAKLSEPGQLPGNPKVQSNAAGGGFPTGDHSRGAEVSGTRRGFGSRNLFGKANKIFKKAVTELNKEEPALVDLGKSIIGISRGTPKSNQRDQWSIQKDNTMPSQITGEAREPPKQLLETQNIEQKAYSGLLPAADHADTREVQEPKRFPGTQNIEQNADSRLLPAADHADTREVQEPRRFIGAQNLIGFAPSGARVGDSICTFWGCNVGVVVRRVGQDRWAIIGRADLSTEKLSTIIKGRAYSINMSTNTFNLMLDLEALQKLTS